MKTLLCFNQSSPMLVNKYSKIKSQNLKKVNYQTICCSNFVFAVDFLNKFCFADEDEESEQESRPRGKRGGRPPKTEKGRRNKRSRKYVSSEEEEDD